ncbi:hypothetical protein EYF80_035652 [Liparis tanakae]|uniref:Uncharacterized protein n=1 Tax=Liparis tanakae TaxID=230148 RepID=A0A4Z2GMY0_9TELE|nr:hypothetical protein EYF80_035652 [Liparis tanakae]
MTVRPQQRKTIKKKRSSEITSHKGQHHVELGLVRPSLALILGVEGQGQRVVVAQLRTMRIPLEGHTDAFNYAVLS